MTSALVILGSVAGALASFWIVCVVRGSAFRLGLVDEPNARSSHVRPTPRGGGIGIIGGAWIGLLIALKDVRDPSVWTVLLCATFVSLVGLADDVWSLSPGFRLAAQTTAAAVVVASTGHLQSLPLPAPLSCPVDPPVLGQILSVLWIVAVTNFYNFMDGIDGLAGGQAIASCVGVALAGWSAGAVGLSAVVGAASLGFVFHNWAPARIFMGDVGSGFLGFVIASLPFLAPPSLRSDALLAVGIGLSLFILDPLETLWRRAQAGKRLTQSHREHRYQELVGPGEPVGWTSASLVAAGLALSLLGAAFFRKLELGWVALAAALAAFLVERVAGSRRARRRRESAEAAQEVPSSKGA